MENLSQTENWCKEETAWSVPRIYDCKALSPVHTMFLVMVQLCTLHLTYAVNT